MLSAEATRFTTAGGFMSMDALVNQWPQVVGDEAGHQPRARTILYVEDNPVNVMLMQAVLEDTPEFALDIADCGDMAWQMVRRNRPDVLLLDMHLPDTNGMALLALLRQVPDMLAVPAIAVSADAMPCDVSLALKAGFVDYWTKPLDIARIVPTLRALVANAPVSGGTMQV